MLFIEKILWDCYNTGEHLDPEYEDVLFWLDELIAIDKFVWN